MMLKNEPIVSLSQAAYEQIKQKIVSLELRPGEVIDEAALQRELHLGRTPIREALKRLALEKLVNIIPRRGMFVTEIGARDLQRLFEMRVELESMAARLATQRGTAAHWQQMSDILDQLPPNDSPDDNETMIKIDRTCHQILYQATDNEFLQDILETMYTLSLRLWYFGLPQMDSMRAAVLEHKEILEAARGGDAELAASLTTRHIQGFQAQIQAMLLGKTTQ
jgi:DNA-binding GntR family transcriptional regulator